MAKRDGILIGTHYEYPFGGMATWPEWLPQGEEDWLRDLEMIKDTGFDSIRVRIGLDSSLDDVARLLDLCQELESERCRRAFRRLCLPRSGAVGWI